MGILDDISAGIASFQRKIENQRAHNAELQRKIERLEQAKKSVNTAYHDAQDLKSSIVGYDPSSTWAGQKYANFHTYKVAAASQAGGMVDDINTNYNAICDKITQLQNEMTEGWGLLSLYASSVNGLRNEWNKAWHSLFG